MFTYLFLFIERQKKRLKYWSEDLIHEKSFELSSRTPLGFLLTSCPEQVFSAFVVLVIEEAYVYIFV